MKLFAAASSSLQHEPIARSLELVNEQRSVREVSRITWCTSYALPAILVLLGATGLLWRNGLIATPIYASDEYAYLAHGKFFSERAAVLDDDAWLQRIPNVLYFRVIQAAYASTSDGYQTIKALNVVLYSIVGLGFGAMASALRPRLGCWFLGLYFLLPWSGYTTSLQPEVLAYFLSCCVAFTAVAAVLRHSLFVSAGAGLLCAASLYVKPNTAGVALGTGLFLLACFGGCYPVSERLKRSALAFVCFAGALYGGLLVWYWISGSGWSWLPQLAGSHYADELNRQSGGAIRTVSGCLIYGAGYILAFLVLFPGGLMGVVRAASTPGDAAGPKIKTRDAVLRGLACWFVPVFIASTAMVSYYSVKIGGERLHGRYLGFVLPFLLLFTLACIHRRNDTNSGRQRSSLRTTGALLAAAALLWWAVGANYFNIYPWDSPELLSLFSAAVGEEVLWSTQLIVLVAAVATAGLLVWYSRLGRWVLITYTVLWMVLGNRNNLAWYHYVKARGGASAAEAAALARTAELEKTRGLVIGSERYGAMSYALFGLAARVAVMVRPPNTQILPHDLPEGCRWVLLQGEYDARIEHRGAIRTRSYRLLLLEPPSGINVEPARDALPQ